MTRLAPDTSQDDVSIDADGVTVAHDSTRARTRSPLRTAGRILVGGMVAIMMALGLLAATDAPAAQAKSTYITTKYQAPRYGQTNTAVRNLQLRLADVDMLKSKYVTSYFGDITQGAVKDFRASVGLKRGKGKVTKKMWKKLVKKSGKVKASGGSKGSSGNSASGIDKRCKVSGRVLCIDKTQRKVRYMVSGKVIKTMDARFGCSNSPTREGNWKIFRKVRHDVSYQYNSPMPFSMYFSGGEAVHYSSDFAARGYNGCSHGCVNIRDKKTLKYVYNRIRVGDRAVVYWS
ncbi:L,D-transpeptidase family protein [Microlunatus soli]|uniref:L,D-transpeptidase catalytic domain n=1 Tax=Microlunatus soli TaxID=630515 RepID=A0A1H1S2Q2_9ACTN|nr:L,D-transpeptidase family protein [Microlunatus soli]SDS42224.1 L,D-transpeptidase catalytic domain [Microlunatus soli]